MTPLPHRRMLLILGATVFVAMIGVGIIVPFLPLYARDLGASGVLMGLIFSSFSLSRAVALPFVGSYSDRYGRKLFIIVGLAGYAASALLLLLTTSALELVINRLFQGVFAAMVLPVGMALVADVTPPGQEGRVFGGFNMSFLMGFGLGPLIGGAVYEYASLEANFWLMAALSLAALAAVVLFVHEPPPAERLSGRRSLAGQMVLLKDRSFQGILLARMGGAVGMGCFISFLPVICADKGLGNLQVGLFITANVLLMTFMQKPFGNLADRWPRLPLAAGGLMLSGVLKIILPLGQDFTQLLTLSIAEGLAAGLGLPALTAMAISRGKALGEGMGLTTATFTMALSVGVFLGPVTGGYLADLVGRHAAALWLGGGGAIAGALAMVGLQLSARAKSKIEKSSLSA
ncbi:MAG: MFS transporter [Thermodesulfobacteriota bacterium]